MPSLTDLLSLLICPGLPLLIAVWLVWLTRRPSRSCPGCSARISAKAKRCPACGISLTEEQSPDAPAQESEETQRKGKKHRRGTKPGASRGGSPHD